MLKMCFIYPIKDGESVPHTWADGIKNVPGKFKKAIEVGNDMTNGMWDFGKVLGKISSDPLYYPNEALHFVVVNGLPIFTLSAIVASYFYMMGSKKAGRFVGYSVYLYLLSGAIEVGYYVSK